MAKLVRKSSHWPVAAVAGHWLGLPSGYNLSATYIYYALAWGFVPSLFTHYINPLTSLWKVRFISHTSPRLLSIINFVYLCTFILVPTPVSPGLSPASYI